MKKTKRFFALLLALFLAGLYIFTLIASFIDAPMKENLLKACIYSTVVIPCLLYAYLLIYRVLKKHNQTEQEDIPFDTKSPDEDSL